MHLNGCVAYANGDARKVLGMIEGARDLYGEVTIETLNKALESPHLRYDKKGEEHYDTISAFIKSMRASPADAAMYYLARMVEAGEDPLSSRGEWSFSHPKISGSLNRLRS